jgi:phenylacetate-CoA ligase|tara:strand:- start:177 stop:1478 length:1302 start_codon:yes stop_codon:yes gene_type:complete
MKFINKIRKKSFWLIDFLNGSVIKKHLEEVQNVLNDFNSKKSLSIRTLNEDNILKHAITTVPFYQSLKNLNSLKDFPVINKNSIRGNFAALQSSKYSDKNKNIVSTSGSTGAPLQISQDANKRKRNSADTAFFASRAGYTIGEELIYIKLWPNSFGIKNLSGFLKNVKMHSVYKLSDIDISILIKKIKNNSNNLNMVGYSGSYEKICNYLDKINSQPIKCNMKSIIANSERLSDTTKKSMEKYFGCKVVSRYSNNENGILAQQNLVENDKFEINWASYNIEILDLNEDKPVSYGEIGRVVVTDFFNYATPIIRYDTGDVAVMNIHNNVPYIERIEGRKLDMIYNTSGEIISSHLCYHLSKYGPFKQYQLVQYGLKDYNINLNTNRRVEKEKDLVEEFKGYFGKDANIKVNYVDEIPVLNSGKRKEVTNTYYKN